MSLDLIAAIVICGCPGNVIISKTAWLFLFIVRIVREMCVVTSIVS